MERVEAGVRHVVVVWYIVMLDIVCRLELLKSEV